MRKRETVAYGIAAGAIVAAIVTPIVALSQPPRTVTITETVTIVQEVTSPECAEYAAQLDAYAADVTETFDYVLSWYDTGVEYHWSMRADNLEPLEARRAYIDERWGKSCAGAR